MAQAILEGGQRGHTALTVLYDERCPLCRKLREWLGRQATTLPIEFVAAASPEARRRFPTLDHQRTITLLTVVARNGADVVVTEFVSAEGIFRRNERTTFTFSSRMLSARRSVGASIEIRQSNCSKWFWTISRSAPDPS